MIDGRVVVLLCGPAGAGKTTAARVSGLTVYDRDDPQWHSEATFRATLARLAYSHDARAVVIRACASSSARAKAAQLIGATHVYLLVASRSELGQRVAHRNRADKVHGLASIRSWFERFDQADRVKQFPGWQHVGSPNYRPLPPAPLAKPRHRWPKASTAARGYGAAHQVERARWAVVVQAGQAWCARCSRHIRPGQPWDLDHASDRTTYLGPAHRRCNRVAGGRQGAMITNAKRRRARLPTW